MTDISIVIEGQLVWDDGNADVVPGGPEASLLDELAVIAMQHVGATKLPRLRVTIEGIE